MPNPFLKRIERIEASGRNRRPALETSVTDGQRNSQQGKRPPEMVGPKVSPNL
ncbi:MAG: hypothetical protein WBF93_17590 [Pirellulales bacterium]